MVRHAGFLKESTYIHLNIKNFFSSQICSNEDDFSSEYPKSSNLPNSFEYSTLMHVHTLKIKITMRTQSVYQFLVSGSFVKVFNHDLVSGDRSPFPSSSSAALTCSDRDEPRFSLLKHLKDMRGKGGELSLLLVCKIQ